MKATMLASVLLVASAVGASANTDPGTCASERSVRDAAVQINAKEIVPLRSGSGHEFLMLVLHNGQGLIVSRNDKGCFDTMMAMPEEAVTKLLTLSQAS